MTLKVLLLEPVPVDIKDYEARGYEVESNFGLSEAQLVHIIGQYHIVYIADRKELLTEEVLNSANKLLAIGIFGNYFLDQVYIPSATAMGIPVFLARYQHQASVGILLLM
jgi:phosphoglycerate dehydrogenase-like enzyme